MKKQKLQDQITEIEEKIEILQDEIEDLNTQISNFEIDQYDYEDQYCDMLDDCYGDFMNMQASRILRECDPIAYRCGLNDFVSGIDVNECEKYKDLEEEVENLENEIDDLKLDIEILQDEIDELE